MWNVATTDEFDVWFADLDEDGQAEIIAKVELKNDGQVIRRTRQTNDHKENAGQGGASHAGTARGVASE